MRTSIIRCNVKGCESTLEVIMRPEYSEPPPDGWYNGYVYKFDKEANRDKSYFLDLCPTHCEMLHVQEVSKIEKKLAEERGEHIW